MQIVLKRYILLFLLLVNTPVLAQLQARFSASDTSICVPQPVDFTDFSTGSIKDWQWDFGEGGPKVNTHPKASHTYSTKGVYHVILTVTDSANKKSTHEIIIYAYDKPNVNFITTGDSAGCVGITVHLKDISVNAGTTIVHWKWDFGDGTNDQTDKTNLQHQYNYQGNYPVALTLVNQNGCENTKLKQFFIKVSDPPQVSFSTPTPQACTPPLIVNFVNTSTGNGSLMYKWTFGDASALSTQNAPSHTYNAFSTYTVKLVATDLNHCSDSATYTNYIKIVPIASAFTTLKDTVCIGENLKFSNTSQGSSSFKWYFKDGSPINTSTSPNHSFAVAGDYIVKLISSSGSGANLCIDSSSKKINVESVVADFTTSQHYSCSLPITITYTDASTTSGIIAKWKWRFGYGDTSKVQGPIAHPYNAEGSFNDTLIITTKHGCKAQKVYPKNVITALMHASFGINVTQGCAPLSVIFTENSIPIPSDPITSWTWDFGDGRTSTQKNPGSLIYSIDGIYKVLLAIKNASGCTDTVSTIIKVGARPHADFSFTPTTGCASDGFQFTDLSTPNGKVNQWNWNFSSGNVPNPKYYPNNVGVFGVRLIAGYNGCYDTIVKIGPDVKGAIVKASVMLVSCNDPRTFQFNAVSMIATSHFKWIFDDGTIDSVHANPVHTFANTTASYYTKLIGYNTTTGCTDTSFNLVNVVFLKIGLNVDALQGCTPVTIRFNPTSSIAAINYDWNLDDGQTANYSLSFSHTYFSAGIFNPKLTITDANGCKKDTSVTIKSYKPQTKIMTDKLKGCIPLTITFTDSTVDNPTDGVIKTWDWNFGDGQAHKTVKNPGAYPYTLPGIKTVILKTNDSLGCMGIDSVKITASKVQSGPTLPFNKQACLGTPMQFNGTISSGNALKYTWNFGDGGISHKISPQYTYTHSGKFVNSLTVEDTTSGCIDTKVKNAATDTIFVQDIPVIAFIADTTNFSCYPKAVNFTNNTTYHSYGGRDTLKYFWSLGLGGAQSTLKNPDNNYSLPGSFDVSLRAISTFGCADTLVKPKYINLHGPLATFVASKDTICKGNNVIFTITSKSNVFSFNWDLGDGHSNVTDAILSHRYTEAYPKVSIKLVIYDSTKTCFKLAQPETKEISIRDVFAAFSLSDSVICKLNSISISDTSHNELSRNWTFGDGGTSVTKQNTHAYNIAGAYPLKLTINGKFGCKDTLIRQILVNPLPTINTTGGLLCQGDSIKLLSTTTTPPVTYNWYPTDVTVNNTLDHIKVSPANTTVYTLEVKDSNNCKNSDTAIVRVQQYLTLGLGATAKVIIGQTVKLDAKANPFGVNYKWTPPDDLSCTTCPDPVTSTLVSKRYFVEVTDTNGCNFKDTASVYIDVLEKYSVDVPNAFTPNGDGINDLIFVNGWGIKELVSYKIYNRWGELVFESTDIKQGWDGYYKGELQNAETYVYTVVAETYDGKTITKKGSLSLLR